MSESQLKVEYGEEILHMDRETLIKAYGEDKKRFVEAVIAYCCTLPQYEVPIQALSVIANIVKCTFEFKNGNTEILVSAVGRPGVQTKVKTVDSEGKTNIFSMAWNGLKSTFEKFVAWIASVIEAIKNAVASFAKGFGKKKPDTKDNTDTKGE